MLTADALRGLDIFDGLNADELEAVSAFAEQARYPRGYMIFSEDEEAERLYVLKDGEVAIQFEVGRHQEAVVHIATPGTAFGWSALVQPYRFTASARCMTDSEVVTIDREGIRGLMEQDCHIGFVIMEKLAGLISGRLRETRIQLISMIHG